MNCSVFLAHCSQDRDRVRDYYHLLCEDGFRPWFDEFSPDRAWEHEIGEAIANSRTVVLFLTENSSEQPGYLHEELLAVMECAEQLPEGSVDILPIRIDQAPVPQRVAHLPCLTLSSGEVASSYLKLRATLAPKPLTRQSKTAPLRSLSLPPAELEAVTAGVKKLAGSGPAGLPASGLFPDATRVMELMIPGKYLVLGQNGDGTRYYGRAEILWEDRAFALTTTIGDDVFRYRGTRVKQALAFDGSHHVVYRRHHSNGCLFGEWDEGGLETLIPALNFGPDS